MTSCFSDTAIAQRDEIHLIALAKTGADTLHYLTRTVTYDSRFIFIVNS